MSLRSERRARRDYPCDRECGEPIRKGTRYVRGALPPGREPMYGEVWLTIRTHGHNWEDCPANAAKLAADT